GVVLDLTFASRTSSDTEANVKSTTLAKSMILVPLFYLEVPEQSSPLAAQELQIGGAPRSAYSVFLAAATFWRGWQANGSRDEIYRRVSPRLAGDIAAVGAFQHQLFSNLPGARHRGAMGPCPAQIRHLLYTLYSGRVLRPRGRRHSAGPADGGRQRSSRHLSRFRRCPNQLRANRVAADFLGGVRVNDLGRAALSLNGSATAEKCETPWRRGGIP